MDTHKSKISPISSHPRLQQRRRSSSLIEEYYAWKENEFEAALVAAALKEIKNKTPPPTPTYERRYRQIDDMHFGYRKNQKKKDKIELKSDHELDIFNPAKEKKFSMYPIVPGTPDSTPCLSPNLSVTSFGSSLHHHSSFPHLPNIDENEQEDDDLTNKPITINFKPPGFYESSAQKSITSDEEEKPEQKAVQEKLMPKKQEEKKPRTRKVSSTKKPTPDVVDLEKAPAKHEILDQKLTKWELVQIFVPWVMIVTSVLQIWLYYMDSDEFFRVFVFSPIKMAEIWRVFTYVFLHTNLIHLAFNIVIQIILAIPLEFEQSHTKVFGVYFGGAVLGAMGASMFESSRMMIGASAGVYSLLMSHIPHTILNRQTIRYPLYRIGVVIVLCVSDFIFLAYHVNSNGNSEPKIGITAHIFGGIGGLLLGTIIYNFIAPEDRLDENLPKYYKLVRTACIGVIVMIAISTVVYYLLVTSS